MIHGQGLMAPENSKAGREGTTDREDDKSDIKESYNLPEYLELFKTFDWSSSYTALGMNDEGIKLYKTFIRGDNADHQGVMYTYKIPEAESDNNLHPSMLNEKQEYVYRLVGDRSAFFHIGRYR